jgi:hypothetical protein
MALIGGLRERSASGFGRIGGLGNTRNVCDLSMRNTWRKSL